MFQTTSRKTSIPCDVCKSNAETFLDLTADTQCKKRSRDQSRQGGCEEERPCKLFKDDKVKLMEMRDKCKEMKLKWSSAERLFEARLRVIESPGHGADSPTHLQ